MVVSQNLLVAFRKEFIYLFLIETSEVQPRSVESESEDATQKTTICKLSSDDL